MEAFPVSEAVEAILTPYRDLTSPEVLDLLQGLGVPDADVARELAAYRAGEVLEVEALDRLIEDIGLRKHRHARRAEVLETLIADFHPETNTENIGDTRTPNIRWQQNPGKVETDENFDLLGDYVRVTPASRKPNKLALAVALKQGSKVKGARMEPGAMRLVLG